LPAWYAFSKASPPTRTFWILDVDLRTSRTAGGASRKSLTTPRQPSLPSAASAFASYVDACWETRSHVCMFSVS